MSGLLSNENTTLLTTRLVLQRNEGIQKAKVAKGTEASVCIGSLLSYLCDSIVLLKLNNTGVTESAETRGVC